MESDPIDKVPRRGNLGSPVARVSWLSGAGLGAGLFVLSFLFLLGLFAMLPSVIGATAFEGMAPVVLGAVIDFVFAAGLAEFVRRRFRSLALVRIVFYSSAAPIVIVFALMLVVACIGVK